MKDLFGFDIEENKPKYVVKVETPIYEPKPSKPHVFELYDDSKAERMVQRIKKSNVSDDVKRFLLAAASRHIKFNYGRIADFYAHADEEAQKLMEESALVIIDYDLAVERGFVKLQKGLSAIVERSRN